MGVLEGRVAIVTAGGGIGMGSAISKLFAKEGAAVVVADVDAERAEIVAQEIKSAGGQAIAAPTDVTQGDQVERMAKAAVDAFGKISILINHAGIGGGKPIEDMEEAYWDAVIGVNLKGTYLCTRAVAPHMKAERWGRIVSTVSKAGFRISNNVMGLCAYGAAKYGMVGFSRAMALELGPWNITANCIAPGFVEGSGMKDPRTGQVFVPTAEQQLGGVTNAGQIITPLRYATAEEAAHTFLYFVGPTGDRVTGTTMHLNGGSYFGV
jgi:NAD(P)-dependent dehydrogenase (short-subunit alcohol dehydrogenase family)